MQAALELAVAGLVAGGSSSAGVPYSSLPTLFPKPQLELIRFMESGFPSPTTLREIYLPKAVKRVKELITKQLATLPTFSFAIDGLSSDFLYGAKCVALNAVSPALAHPITLALVFMVKHETAERQVLP